jgi:hypothetical protein
MFLPQSIVSRSRCHAISIVLIVIFSVSAMAQQPNPAEQLPDQLRGAKIYQLPTQGGQPASNPGVYKSLAFNDINFERLVLSLFVSIRPVDRAATVERIYFQDVRVGGIPVHVETFNDEFKLSNKSTVDLPKPLKVSIIFAELDSLRPIREMVDKDKIQITGQTFIEVKLTSLEKVMLRAKQLVIPSTLDEYVAMNLFQGNPLLKSMADKIMDTLADPSSAAAVSMAKERLARLHQNQTVGRAVKPALYLLYTEYEIYDPKSKVAEKLCQSGAGFLVSTDGKILTTKRVIAPWKFDPQVIYQLQQQHLEMDKNSVKIYAWPAGTPVTASDGQRDFHSALSTEKQTLWVLETPPDQMAEQDYQDPESVEPRKVNLHIEGDADLALLQITGTSFHPLSFQDAAAGFSDASKLVLCSYPFGVSQSRTDPRLLSVKGDLRGTVLTMDHEVDPGESGAPLVNGDGKVVALAASRNQCISIQTARRLMP